MTLSCEQVWREISNYLDDDVTPELRTSMENHIAGCSRCTAVLEGTRNVLELYSDERMIDVPLGFSHRLHRRLEEDMAGKRRTFVGWLVAAAATVLVCGGFEIARSSAFGPPLRSALARHAKDIPPDLTVVVAEEGRIFHVPGCEFIHDKSRLRTLPASDAVREGYSPCIRCLPKYLPNEARSRKQNPDGEYASAPTRGEGLPLAARWLRRFAKKRTG